jgi:EAL domain-containing protein (putative c-di-GMP-specific phosphodiesterase class I)
LRETAYFVASLQALGCKVSLDDFGSGFSSLNYLRRLPVDFLKIDRSFIQELPADKESQIITSSVISLAHTLEMQVIAEGVETKEQLDFLGNKACDFIQGFIFFKPMPFDQLQDAYQKIKGKM